MKFSEYFKKTFIFFFPFFAISLIDIFHLNRVDFDLINGETIPLFYGSANSFFFQDLITLDKSITHHPNNFLNSLSIIFFYFFDNNQTNYILYSKLSLYLNYFFILIMGAVVSHLSQFTKLDNHKIFISSLLCATLPGVIIFSSLSINGYYSFGIIILPLALSSYILLNKNNYQSSTIFTSLIFFGFAINVSYLALTIIFPVLIIFIIRFLMNKESLILLENNSSNKKYFGKISLFIFIFSFFFFLIRTLLFLISFYIYSENYNHLFYQLGNLNFLIITLISTIIFFYFILNLKFIKKYLYNYILYFSIGWFIGSNILSLGWFRSFFLKATLRGTGDHNLYKGGYDTYFDSFSKSFFELPIFYFFFFINLIFIGFLLKYKKIDFKNFIFLYLIFFITIFLTFDLFFTEINSNGYNKHRFLSSLGLVIIYVLLLENSLIKKRFYNFFLIIIISFNYFDYYKFVNETNIEIKNVNNQSNIIVDNHLNKFPNSKIYCNQTFIPSSICSYIFGENLITLFSDRKYVNEDNIYYIRSKIPKLRENDLFITGEDVLIEGDILMEWIRDKNKFEINPFVRIIRKN